MGARRKGREAALQMLYQMDASGQSAEEVVRTFWAHLAHGTPAVGNDAGEDTGAHEGQEFANELVLGVGREAARIDEAIRAASDHWRIERMARVDRNVLRLGCWEILFAADVPRRVTINEAIELAKRYGESGSAAFVNGILDRIASDAKKD